MVKVSRKTKYAVAVQTHLHASMGVKVERNEENMYMLLHKMSCTQQ